MSRPPVICAPAAILICSLLLVAGPRWAASAPPAAEARSDDLPHFQPGQWQYRRTLMKAGGDKPQVSTFEKCSDPTTEFRQKIAELEKKGCKFLPARRDQQGYVSQWICPTPAGPVNFRDVLISQNDTAYQTVTEAHGSEQVVRTTIDALRLGECRIAGIPKSNRAKLPFFLKQGPQQ